MQDRGRREALYQVLRSSNLPGEHVCKGAAWKRIPQLGGPLVRKAAEWLADEIDAIRV